MPHFSFPLLLPWMTLPVSEVINSFGEAQSRIGRRAESRSQEAWILSLADDVDLEHTAAQLPAFCLPSFTCSFILASIEYLWSVYYVPGILHAVVTKQTQCCPQGAYTLER